MRETVDFPHKLVDEHTLLAQRYAGYFVGHPYRAVQETTLVTVDKKHRWKEPSVVADGCIFCVRLTDEEATQRIAGYQYQIDVESTRTKMQYWLKWESTSSDVPEPGVRKSWANLRRFCELFQGMATEKRSNGWKTRPFPLVNLPLRLKRKLVIGWNHIYLRWLEENNLQYDFNTHKFWREVDNTGPDSCPHGVDGKSCATGCSCGCHHMLGC